MQLSNPFDSILNETTPIKSDFSLLGVPKSMTLLEPSNQNTNNNSNVNVSLNDNKHSKITNSTTLNILNTTSSNNNKQNQIIESKNIDDMINEIADYELKILNIQKSSNLIDKTDIYKRLQNLKSTYELLAVGRDISLKSPSNIYEDKGKRSPSLIEGHLPLSPDGRPSMLQRIASIMSLDNSSANDESATNEIRYSSFDGNNFPSHSKSFDFTSMEEPKVRGFSMTKGKNGKRLSIDVATTSAIPPSLSRKHSDRFLPMVNEDSCSDSQRKNFLEFSVVGVNADILCGIKEPKRSRMQQAMVVDTYPPASSELILGDAISDFAMPHGAWLELAYDMATAEAIVKRSPDQYHILQFSDKHGTPSYACCLTVTEYFVIDTTKHINLFNNMLEIETLKVACNIIKCFYRCKVKPVINQRKQQLIKDSMNKNNSGNPNVTSTASNPLSNFGLRVKQFREGLKSKDSTPVRTPPPLASSRDARRDSGKFLDSLNIGNRIQNLRRASRNGDDSDVSETSSVSTMTTAIRKLSKSDRNSMSKDVVNVNSTPPISKKGIERKSRLQYVVDKSKPPCLVMTRTFCLVSVHGDHSYLFKVCTVYNMHLILEIFIFIICLFLVI
jgi:hypothetical protein